MKKYLLFLPLFASILLGSCSGGPGGEENGREGNGGRIYGGVLHLNETERFHTLYPYNLTDIISFNLAAQVYEGLVKFNPRNITEIRPSLADSWKMDESGTVYTFTLKKGVHFQDDSCFPEGKGREVLASDFIYSFELLCSQSSDNQLFNGTFRDRVKGANEYYEESASGKPSKGIEGLKATDDHTLQITLSSPSASFLYILASPGCFVVAKEGIDKYGNKLKFGTGPFIIPSADNKAEKIFMVKNKNYHGVDSLGNKLPFLDSIIVSFLPTKSKELEAFKGSELDVVFGLPSESISEMVEQQIKDFREKPVKYLLDRTPELATQYYEFNMSRPPFNNVKVRQAFNYAINRERIIETVLNGEAYGPGIYGICPQSLIGYDVTQIKGYKYDPEMAKKLMAEAGYPDGKGFPTITIEVNSGGAKNSKVVEEIKNQLENTLKVNILYNVVPFSQKLEDARYSRGADIFRSSWIADYPSPENFLWTLYGKTVPDSLSKPSYPNVPRYKNAEFDKFFEAGRSSQKRDESYADFLKAEQIMVNDAPILVLWHDENLKLAQSYVKNFHFNPMNYHSFSEVYIKKDPAGSTEKKEEEKKGN
jgi:oligopeptide transport system substrate-binding protein